MNSTPILLSPPSELEAKLYYAGLPSRTRLVARSSTTTWEPPADPESDPPVLKELRPAGDHPLKAVWEAGFARQVLDLLEASQVDWTTLDVVRIGDRDADVAPVVLWVGVAPGSLSGEDGVVVVSRCKTFLEENGVADVDVEIRESEVWPDQTSPPRRAWWDDYE